MAGTTDMNIVLGQGNAVKAVHNVRKEHLELNQQFVAQKTEEKRIEDRSKIQRPETGKRVEIKDEDKEKEKRDLKEQKKASGKDQSSKRLELPEGNLIDIKV